MLGHIQPIPIEEYAQIQSLQGNHITRVGNVYWRKIGRFFYRPLVAYSAIDAGRLQPPCGTLGGYQHAVPDQSIANSTINFRVFDECQQYSIDTQNREHRRMVRKAMKSFDIRLIQKDSDLKGPGYEIYTRFYERTHYGYLSERSQREHFNGWVDTLFASPKTIILGAYEKDHLKAVSICYWIDNIFLYSTFFSDTVALKQHVADLMLHVVRDMVSEYTEIGTIVAGLYGGGIGSDAFDLLRGAKIERRPAQYVMRPGIASAMLRACSPARYQKLTGSF